MVLSLDEGDCSQDPHTGHHHYRDQEGHQDQLPGPPVLLLQSLLQGSNLLLKILKVRLDLLHRLADLADLTFDVASVDPRHVKSSTIHRAYLGFTS